MPLTQGSYELPSTIVPPKIGSVPMQELMLGHPMIVPVFQRRYCWGRDQIKAWWRDTVAASARVHTIGKVVLAAHHAREHEMDVDAAADEVQPSDWLVVVDGQQRLTTASLTVAAIRQRAFAIASSPSASEDEVSRAGKVAAACTRMLYMHNSETSKALHLTPSLLDRESFIHCVDTRTTPPEMLPTTTTTTTTNNAGGDPNSHGTEATSTAMTTAFRMLTALCANQSASFLAAVLDNLAHRMQVVRVLMTDDTRAAQDMFLWLQEKETLGSFMTHNPRPGMGFRFSDMLRNMVMAHCCLVATPKEAERIYRSTWLALETLFPSRDAFDEYLVQYAADAMQSKHTPDAEELKKHGADNPMVVGILNMPQVIMDRLMTPDKLRRNQHLALYYNFTALLTCITKEAPGQQRDGYMRCLARATSEDVVFADMLLSFMDRDRVSAT